MAKRIPLARQKREAAGVIHINDTGDVTDVEMFERRTTPLGMTNKPGPKPRKRKPGQVMGSGGGAGAFGDRTPEEVIEIDREAKKHQTVVKVRITGKMADLWMGRLSVQDMDNEELARMQFKDTRGRFSGHPPRCLPHELVKEIRKELVQRATAQFDGSLLEAIKALTDIAGNADFEPKDRLRAANLIIERSLGKVSETVVVSGDQENPVNVLLTRIDRSGRPDPKVIEGTVLPPGTVRQADVVDLDD